MRFALLTLALFLSACASVSRPQPQASPLTGAMAQRLALSLEVAWIKYLGDLPVRDPQREAAVLDRMSALAAARGMDAARVRAFFAAQIAASCAEQECLIRGWSRGTLPLPAFPPRSLAGGVRRDIDAVNLAILRALVTPPLPSRKEAENALRAAGFCARASRRATQSLVGG